PPVELGRAVRLPDPWRVGGDLLDAFAARDAPRLVAHHGVPASRARGRVVLLDQQPVLTVLAGARAGHAHQRPAAAQLLAPQLDLELAVAPPLERIALERSPGAAVPEQHGAAAVLAGRDDPLEAAVLERVVLHLHRQALFARIEAGSLGHRPA